MGISEELARLSELHDRGELTDEEFRTAKARVLAGQVATPMVAAPPTPPPASESDEGDGQAGRAKPAVSRQLIAGAVALVALVVGSIVVIIVVGRDDSSVATTEQCGRDVPAKPAEAGIRNAPTERFTIPNILHLQSVDRIGDTLVVLDSHGVRGYNPSTGDERWRVDGAFSEGYAWPDGDTYVVVEEDPKFSGVGHMPVGRGVIALDAQTGAERWSEHSVGSFTTQGDTTIAIEQNRVRDVDTRTGEQRWSSATAAQGVDPFAHVFPDRVEVFGDDLIEVHGACTGNVQWSTQARRGVSVGDVYVQVDQVGQANLFEYVGRKASDGTELWRTRVEHSTSASEYAVGDSAFLIEDSAGHEFIAVDAASGKELWRRPTHGGIQTFDLAVSDDGSRLSFPDGSTLVTVDVRTGEAVAELDTHGASVAAIDKTVAYLITNDGVLRAIDRTTGEELWSVDTHDGNSVVQSGPGLLTRPKGDADAPATWRYFE